MAKSDNMSRKIGMTERDMLKHITEEIRLLRLRVEDQNDQNNTHFFRVQKDVSKIREDMAGHKVKLTGITTGIAVFVTAIIHWLFGSFK